MSELNRRKDSRGGWQKQFEQFSDARGLHGQRDCRVQVSNLRSLTRAFTTWSRGTSRQCPGFPDFVAALERSTLRLLTPGKGGRPPGPIVIPVNPSWPSSPDNNNWGRNRPPHFCVNLALEATLPARNLSHLVGEADTFQSWHVCRGSPSPIFEGAATLA